MATNLKTGKKIRAFCYRMLALGAFFVMVSSAITGRDALWALHTEGLEIFTGKFYCLPEFQAYMEELYSEAMLGYAGVGDDNGYPLTDEKAREISRRALETFHNQVDAENGTILYAVQWGIDSPDKKMSSIQGNISYPVFSEYDGHLLLPDDTVLCYYWNGPENLLQTGFDQDPSALLTTSSTTVNGSLLESSGLYRPNQNNIGNIRLLIAIKAKGAYGEGVLSAFGHTAKSYQIILLLFFGSTFFALLFLVLCLFSKKVAREAKASYAGFTGKIWLELKLILILLFAVWVYFTVRHYPLFELSNLNSLFPVSVLFFTGACLFYLLYIDFSQNGEKVFRNSLPVKLVLYIKEFVRSLPWYRRIMTLCTATLLGALLLFATGIGLLSLPLWNMSYYTRVMLTITAKPRLLAGILFLFAGLLVLILFFRLRRFTKDTKAIADRLSDIRLGELHPPLVLSPHSLLLQSAGDLNQLESSIENAVEQKNRSNRMRVELITNVSHDLKTPLTSIINYADLLCEEELPPAAAEYASALQKKAYRLKNMVQDVFELSKAASGNLPVEKQVIDLAKLIRQTLADMDERISAGSLTFKLAIATEPVLIEADGEKIYRVFQNLFVNALQYSLDNSRVHIQLSVQDGTACVKVKNTSKWELDFDTQEIMERFVRADASRTSEGSGLGLSIVQSFTEACGGSFTIETDADMFIAIVCFPLAQNQTPPAQVSVPTEPAVAAIAEVIVSEPADSVKSEA